MENNESLHSTFTKLCSLRRKLAALEREEKLKKNKEFISNLEAKFGHFLNLIKSIRLYQEKIYNNKTLVLMKLQDKTITNNSLQLSHVYHEDFKNMILSKDKLQELIEDTEMLEDKNNDLKCVINELKNANSTWRKKYFEQLYAFRSATRLLDNIKQLKIIEKENCNMIEENSDSDLGCYPNDETTVEENAILEHIATSTPIFKIEQS